MRIVSLLPSATEIVYALGLGDSLAGVSHECDFPPAAMKKPKIIESVIPSHKLESGRIDELVHGYLKAGKRLYRIRLEELKKANPDLIITQDLCDVCAIGAEDVFGAIHHLGKHVDVVSLNPHTLADVKEDVRTVAKATGTEAKAEEVVADLERKADAVKNLTMNAPRPRVFCAEWLAPIMNAGHWVPEMVDYAGGREELASRGQPSTYIDWDAVLNYDPEVVVLMPCGFGTRRTIDEAKFLFEMKDVGILSAVRNGRVFATDGHNYFSRSGPRLFDAIGILAHMIHPELFREPLDPELGSRLEITVAKI